MGQAKDVAEAKDFPLAGRYQGSDHGGSEWLKLQGRITQIRYDGPAGRSSLEILANLQAGLAAKGFSTLFDCADDP